MRSGQRTIVKKVYFQAFQVKALFTLAPLSGNLFACISRTFT